VDRTHVRAVTAQPPAHGPPSLGLDRLLRHLREGEVRRGEHVAHGVVDADGIRLRVGEQPVQQAGDQCPAFCRGEGGRIGFAVPLAGHARERGRQWPVGEAREQS
jgi:hypothetical protein